MPPLLERLLHSGIGHVLRGTRRNGRFDQDQAFGIDLFADDLEALLQGADVRVPAPQISQLLLEEVALHVHHQHVGKLQGIVGVGGGEGFLLGHAPLDHGGHFRVLGLDRRDPPVEERNLPEAPGARPLHADHELAGLAGLLVRGIRHHAGHDRAHKSEAHDHHDLLTLFAMGLGQLLQPCVLFLVVLFIRNLELLALRAYGILHAHSPSFIFFLGLSALIN